MRRHVFIPQALTGVHTGHAIDLDTLLHASRIPFCGCAGAVREAGIHITTFMDATVTISLSSSRVHRQRWQLLRLENRFFLSPQGHRRSRCWLELVSELLPGEDSPCGCYRGLLMPKSRSYPSRNVKEREEGDVGHQFLCMPDKQAAMLITTKAAPFATIFEHGIDVPFSRAVWERANRGRYLLLKCVLDPSGATHGASLSSSVLKR